MVRHVCTLKSQPVRFLEAMEDVEGVQGFRFWCLHRFLLGYPGFYSAVQDHGDGHGTYLRGKKHSSRTYIPKAKDWKLNVQRMKKGAAYTTTSGAVVPPELRSPEPLRQSPPSFPQSARWTSWSNRGSSENTEKTSERKVKTASCTLQVFLFSPWSCRPSSEYRAPHWSADSTDSGTVLRYPHKTESPRSLTRCSIHNILTDMDTDREYVTLIIKPSERDHICKFTRTTHSLHRCIPKSCDVRIGPIVLLDVLHCRFANLVK